MNPYTLPGIIHTPEEIIKTVSRVTSIPIKQMQSKTRKRKVVMARQIAMYFIIMKTKTSERVTGEMFGNRDHSTVNWAKTTVNNLVRFDKDYRYTFQKVKTELCKRVS